MTRNLKALGLALVAVLALGAMTASSASAFFDSEKESTTVEGEQLAKHKFTVDAGTTECATAKFHSILADPINPDIPKTNENKRVTGTVTGTAVAGGFTSSSLTMEAIYENCTTPLGAATVNMNSCHYRFTRTGVDAEKTPIGEVHIFCHIAGDQIKVVAGGGICTISIGPQTVKGITYHNKGAGAARDVEVTINSTGIVYTQSAFCPGGGGEKKNGTYTGTATVKGTAPAGTQVGVWVT